ncbi:MAG: hypothetical protein A2341_20765 [Deltaproteobacteria bacterium RIFOXYB12_FULL_58_9]|nr:MAG: hypothetical protein A2341_20765 [Deltaproteobacteria bacterium RIFOXYB12_FULL_58_9]
MSSLGKTLAVATVISMVAAPSVAGSSASRKAYEGARGQYFALKDKKERQQYRHNWLKVIAAFADLTGQYPEAPEAPSAIYTAAELWSDLWRVSRRESDLDQALAGYERVVHLYPNSNLADDALWQRSQLFLYHVKDRGAAARAVREILSSYANGDMSSQAAALAKELSDVPVAKEEVEEEETTGKMVGRRDDRGPIPEVTSIKHWSNPDYTRVAVYLTGPALARSGNVPEGAGKPARVYVDIEKARLSKKVATATVVQDELLQGVRSGQYKAATVRVVLDLEATVKHRVMTMENPYRVVIDAFATDAAAKITPNSGKPLGPDAAETPVVKTTVSKTANDAAAGAIDTELGGRHVVIDPGHGGRDGGACGPGKSSEKDITLAIGREVAGLLKKEGVAVSLTRTADKAIALEERTAFANRANADIFVSIHANSHRSAMVQGIETYYLNVTDDRYSLRLAAVENQTNEEQVSDLQLILADLATKVNTDESVALARRVQRSLMKGAKAKNPRTRDLGVKASLFYVLLGARMPSILVEIGFLSHKHEGKLLTQSAYQKTTAKAIADGVLAHLKAPAETPVN